MMNTFILLIFMIDSQDNESIIANDDTTTKSITYFCVDSLLYRVK